MRDYLDGPLGGRDAGLLVTSVAKVPRERRTSLADIRTLACEECGSVTVGQSSVSVQMFAALALMCYVAPSLLHKNRLVTATSLTDFSEHIRESSPGTKRSDDLTTDRTTPEQKFTDQLDGTINSTCTREAP